MNESFGNYSTFLTSWNYGKRILNDSKFFSTKKLFKIYSFLKFYRQRQFEKAITAVVSSKFRIILQLHIFCHRWQFLAIPIILSIHLLWQPPSLIHGKRRFSISKHFHKYFWTKLEDGRFPRIASASDQKSIRLKDYRDLTRLDRQC